jgi:putative hydrolase of the HAD superfamily
VVDNKSTKLSAILFDLGFTLINFEGNFHKAMHESYVALADALIDSGCPINREIFIKRFTEIISEYYRSREIDLIERPVEESLKSTLASLEIDPLPKPILEKAVNAMYSYTESCWKIEPDTHFVLNELIKRGYHLGLISNAANTPDLNRLVDNHGLRKYFDVVVISAEEGIRKPDPQIFVGALQRLNVKPQNAIMVGDTLSADILGAKRSGMRSVWITKRANRPENNGAIAEIQPDYIIPDLTSMVGLMDQIDKELS